MYRIYSIKHNAFWSGKHSRPFMKRVYRGYAKQRTADAQCARLNDRYPDAKCIVGHHSNQDNHYAS